MSDPLRNAYDVVGQPTPKKDAPLKVAGRAEYADDLSMPGMLHGKLLRSPHPHARIRHINVAPALRRPGVVAAITPWYSSEKTMFPFFENSRYRM